MSLEDAAAAAAEDDVNDEGDVDKVVDDEAVVDVVDVVPLNVGVVAFDDDDDESFDVVDDDPFNVDVTLVSTLVVDDVPLEFCDVSFEFVFVDVGVLFALCDVDDAFVLLATTVGLGDLHLVIFADADDDVSNDDDDDVSVRMASPEFLLPLEPGGAGGGRRKEDMVKVVGGVPLPLRFLLNF
jgi:hypothetical protein